MKFFARSIILFFVIGLFSFQIHAADKFRPYILASLESQPMSEVKNDVESKIKTADFEIVGTYAPYDGVIIYAITRNDLIEAASETELGAFGAVIKVSLTQVDDQVQVIYNNPLWVANIYRLEKDLADVHSDLTTILGEEDVIGSKKGLTQKKLRKYRYMMMMPRFDDMEELAKHENHEAAVAAVEKNLRNGSGGTSKVYRIDLPGKEESVFGVALTQGKASDAHIMGIIDQSEIKHSAHLPYEIVVSGKRVYMLHGKFRIAQSFPDLKIGKFMKISSAPGDIRDALSQVAQ